MEQNIARYHQILNNNSLFFDVIVLTSANSDQKHAFELQIQDHQSRHLIPDNVAYHIVSDDSDVRIGNGGATIKALRHLNTLYGASLKSMKILLIHSGGLSQRSPNASSGKIFATLPFMIGNSVGTMLCLKLASLCYMPDSMRAGVLVTCADDWQVFDGSVSLDVSGVIGPSHPVAAKEAVGHGVYEVKDGVVRTYIHKPPLSQMHPNNKGEVLIDSWFVMDFDTCDMLIQLDGDIDCEIDAYADFLQCLNGQQHDTVDGTWQDRIRLTLETVPLHTVVMEGSKWYHIGSLQEYQHHLSHDIGVYGSAINSDVGQCTLMESIIHQHTHVGIGAVLDCCIVHNGAMIGNGSVLHGVHVPPSITIPDNVYMQTICVDDGFVTLTCGINDDIKNGTCINGHPLDDCLWSAKVHRVCASRDESLLAAIDLVSDGRTDGVLMSMAECTREKSVSWQLEQAAEQRILIAITALRWGSFAEYQCVDEWSWHDVKTLPQALQMVIDRSVVGDNIVSESRWCHSMAMLGRRILGDVDIVRQLSDRGTALLHDAIVYPVAARHYDADVAGDTTCVSLPCRLIFAGGWSDTPSFCLEHASAIVNCSASFDGQLPISAKCYVEEDATFICRVSSIDQGCTTEICSLGDLTSHSDPTDPLALHRAAITLILCPWLALACDWDMPDAEPFNGLCLESNVSLPKGSGLGTSSILALALVRAVSGCVGKVLQVDEEMNMVLAIEQMIGTGGGYQDQIGGGIRGFKLTHGAPLSFPQGPLSFEVSRLSISPVHAASFNARLFCIWTGGTRVAKHVLDGVVQRWTRRVPSVVAAMSDVVNVPSRFMHAMTQYAQLSTDQLGGPAEDEALEAIGSHLDTVRKLYADLEPSAADEQVELIHIALSHALTGSLMMGAGLEGFIVGPLKSGITHDEAELVIKESFPKVKRAIIEMLF